MSEMDVRAAISNAYYEARNNGQTMETAADNAAAAVEAIFAARLARVEALHHCRDETVARPICDVCWDDSFMGHESWPCPTIAALRSDAHTEQKGEGE